jgi:flagellar hook-associated protein 3 FlgL
MRVTNSMVASSTLRDLAGSLSRLQRSQTDLATGRVVRSVSDDPTRASASMALRTQERRADHHQRAGQDATAWLETASATLMSGLDLMSRVKELTVQASNSGSTSAQSRAAIAGELRSIRDEMLAIANTRYVDRPLFNGTAAGPAYDPATGAYLGNAAAVVRQVAPDTTVQVNVTGQAVFGAQSSPSGDLFAVLDRLATAVANDDAAGIAAEHVNADAATQRLNDTVGALGARAARVEGLRGRVDEQRANLLESISSLEDADLAEVLVQMKARENAYNATLQAAAKLLPPSLVDFLR